MLLSTFDTGAPAFQQAILRTLLAQATKVEKKPDQSEEEKGEVEDQDDDEEKEDEPDEEK